MHTIRRSVAAITVAACTLAGFAAATPAHAAVATGGEIVQFGYNAWGQTGDGTPRGAQWKSVVAGGFHTLALRNDGTVWTWGYNGQGQLGNNTTTNSSTPVQVVGPGGVGFLANITSIAAGDQGSLARRNDGTVWAWGSNADGELGNGSTTSSSVPVLVKGAGGVGSLTGVTSISMGMYHSLARKSDGTVWAWGYNFSGQLGDGTTTSRTTPVLVAGPGGITAISATDMSSLARRSDGTVWAWGYNSGGQLGDGTTTNRSIPVQVVGANGSGALNGITAISAAANHSIARRSDGTVWTWGRNFRGQLGTNTPADSNIPVQVTGPGGYGTLTGITAVSAGYQYSVARRSDGTVWTWGYNYSGQLGDGTTTDRSFPGQVLGVTKAIAVDAGDYHVVVLRSPSLAATPGTINFSTIRTSSTATSAPVTITNNDSVDVVVTGISTAGTAAAAFDVNGPALPRMLAPGQSLSVTITATTDATPRIYSAQLVVDTDQPEPLVAPITLKAVDPAWTLGPTAPTFTDTAVGDTVTALLTPVMNTGLVPVTVTTVSFTGANAADFTVSTNSCSGVLAPAAICTVGVTFAPKTAGTKTAALMVVSDAGSKTLGLSAIAKNPADLDVWLSAPGTGTAGVAFASTANITNLGPATAKAVSATVTLSSGGTFTSVSGTGWTCTSLNSVQRRCTRTFLNVGVAANLTINASFPAGSASVSVILDATQTIDVDATDNTATRNVTVS